jgi:hypothetical protein
VPQKDLGSFWELIADLYRETSRTVFWCIIGGMTVGALAATYWLVQFYKMTFSAGLSGYRLWWYGLIVIPAAIVGGVVGCIFGVVIEWMIGFFRGPQTKDDKRRRKKWKAHRASAAKPGQRPSTGFQPPPENSGKRDDKYFS